MGDLDTTKLLLPMITSAVHSAKCELIDQRRCFVIAEAPFYNIMALFFATAREWRSDTRLAAAGYDNIQISLSAVESREYFLATKADSLLDRLWESKGPQPAA